MVEAGAGERDVVTSNREGETNMPSPSKTAPHKNKHGVSYAKFFGVDLSPDNVAVAMVYFVQGVLGLARLAVSFYMKDDLHLDPAEVGTMHVFVFIFMTCGTRF